MKSISKNKNFWSFCQFWLSVLLLLWALYGFIYQETLAKKGLYWEDVQLSTGNLSSWCKAGANIHSGNGRTVKPCYMDKGESLPAA